MGRADTPCGKDIVVFPTHLVHRVDDYVFNVWYHATVANLDAPTSQCSCEVRNVYILSATRKDLVTHNQNASGDSFGHSRFQNYLFLNCGFSLAAKARRPSL